VGGGNVARFRPHCEALGAKESNTGLSPQPGGDARACGEVHTPKRSIIFKLCANPTRVLGTADGWVKGIECIRMELGEPDESGRRRPVPVKGSEFVIDCDVVIPAIGTRANPLLTSATPELKLNKWGYIIADESGATSMPGVYAGGDIVRGAATVILAMGDGKKSAAAIDQYVRAKHNLPPAVAPSPL
jgi:glutamate synthase (NADPH/NADH) small chain